MRARVTTRLLGACGLAAFLTACATGSSAPPTLAYRLPDPTEVTYASGDTLSITIDALGQTLELSVGTTAVYALSFTRAGQGVGARLSVRELQADVSLPGSAPMSVGEEIVQGDLVLQLSRRGDVTILEAPEVEDAASPFLAGPTLAHQFFPGLPGTAVRAGDTWVDTVSYSADADSGDASQRSVTTYTVVGEAVVDGRSLLEISLEGTQEMQQTMSFQGVDVEQRTNLEVTGRVLWDLQRGLMFERETVSTGTGTVRVAIAPTPLPTRVEIRSRARLEPL
jgi:hypothetical protein